MDDQDIPEPASVSQVEPGHVSDRSADPRRDAHSMLISRSATVALWRVINAMRDGWFLEDRLRAVARTIAREAHAQGLRSEQMLVALKHEWPRLVECRRVPSDVELRMLADRLVTFCIQEFYTTRSTGRQPALASRSP